MGGTYARVYVRVSRMTRSCIRDGRRAKRDHVAKGGESPEVRFPGCSYLLNTLFNYSCVNVAFLSLVSICLWLIVGRLSICARQRRALSILKMVVIFLLFFRSGIIRSHE